MKLINSKYTQITFLVLDILIINLVIFIVFEKQHQNLLFFLYQSLFWVFISYTVRYYQVHRYTSVFRVLKLIFLQLILYTISFFAYFGIFKEGIVVNTQFKTLIFIYIALAIKKIFFFYYLKKARESGKNVKSVVFLERDGTSKKMMKLFDNQRNLGYSLVGFFSNKINNDSKYLGTEEEMYSFISTNKIDEIYATLSELKKGQVQRITKFSSLHNIRLKLIPDSKEFYSKNQKVEYYDDTIKVLSVKRLPFDFIENRIQKRIFDIFFSFFAIAFIMSWLVPILWILIKLESKGPLFFTQEREGLKGEKFVCYKFRSMRKNKLANKIHTTKNDARVTKIGAFIRKTSIDELPQFFNVFLGDMSVVGPRPHMESLSIEYRKDVHNYMERHAVKPGITGLAQISGYRGEVRKKSDIKNRVRLDIFYIENWSFFLDVKIIIKTVLNIFQGDEKAY